MDQIRKTVDNNKSNQPDQVPLKSDINDNVTHRQPQQQKTHIIAVQMDAPLSSAHVPRTVPLTDLKKSKVYVQCPHCLQHVYTKTSRGGGVLFFLCFIIAALAFVLFHMLYMMLFQIIFIFTLQDTVHSCPSCAKKIAKYSRFRRLTSVTKANPIHHDENNV